MEYGHPEAFHTHHPKGVGNRNAAAHLHSQTLGSSKTVGNEGNAWRHA